MNKKSSRGRPLKEFDPQIFEGLCGIFCTKEELLTVLGTDPRTLSAWCERFYGMDLDSAKQKFLRHGKASLRRMQMNLARKNAAMAIWLGKQILGQKEHPEELQEFNGKLGQILDLLQNVRNETEFDESALDGYIES